jgi:hypothetical protein
MMGGSSLALGLDPRAAMTTGTSPVAGSEGRANAWNHT